MREFKFRGKCIHSDIWCYGNYATNGVEAEIQGYDVYREDVIDWREVDVEPDTVGQFTGLKDKNGKEIYEGDIYKSNKGGINEVSWISGDGCDFIGFDFSPFHLIEGVISDIEIIGNIHDNPELLKGE
jgi:uncharacterized phage protein (TIGR01671 family)